MFLQVIDTCVDTPEKNMAKDLELLESLSLSPACLLHFYEWEGPSATYGYFSHPEKFLKSEGIAKHNLRLAKRPTGGGSFSINLILPFRFYFQPCILNIH